MIISRIDDIALGFGSTIASALADFKVDVYPLLPAVNARFPFVTYRRAALEEHVDKDGMTAQTLTMELTVAAANYLESLELAAGIRKLMADIIFTCRLADAAEEVEPDGQDAVYLQILTFKIEIE